MKRTSGSSSSHNTHGLGTARLRRKYAPLIDGTAKRPGRIIKKLKSETPESIERVLNSLDLQVARNIACSDPFPRTYAEINIGYVDGEIEFDAEFTWSAVCLGLFSQELQACIGVVERFEREVLLGNYPSAGEALSEFEKAFGVSLWTFESNLLLEELQRGLEGNRQFLVREGADASPLVRVFVDYFSQRVETDVVYSQYSASVRGIVERAHLPRRVAEWFLFRFDGREVLNLRNPAYVLRSEQGLPLIDRYLAFRRIAQRTAFALSSSASPRVRVAVEHIAARVTDPIIEVIAQFLTPQRKPLIDERTSELVQSADAYTVGNYQHAVQLSGEALFTCPQVFEHFELHSLASIHGDMTSPVRFEATSLARQILDATNALISKSADTEDAIRRLLDISVRIDSFPISMQIDAFVRTHKTAGATLNASHVSAYGRCISPRLALLYANERHALAFIDSLASAIPNSVALAIHRAVIANEPLPDAVPCPRRRKYEALRLLRTGMHEKAAAIFTELTENAKNAPQYQDAVAGLFTALTRAQFNAEAAALIVEAHLGAWPSSVRRLDLSLVRFDQVTAAAKASVDWPLFTWIAQHHSQPLPEPKAIFEAYDDFLNYSGVDKPSELRSAPLTFDRQRLILFLSEVCRPVVMNNSIAFETTEDLEFERLQLCQWLLSLDEPRAQTYSKEIAQLTRNGAVRRAIHELRTTKIHIDTRGIRNTLPRAFKDRFERYRRFSSLSETLRTLLGQTNFEELLKEVGLSDAAPVLVLSDASLEQLSELFSEVKARFISSNEYGLDSYLSVRIRHGTLSGQLRAQFERHSLVTAKRGASYLPNESWDEALAHLEANERQRAMEVFRQFSETVDLTIEEVKSTWIQIRGPENNDQGMFDFAHSERELMALGTKVVGLEYDQFVEALFEELWRRTERNLTSIVGAIRTTLRVRFSRALEELARMLGAISPQLERGAIGDAISRCGTETQNALEVIAGWFEGVEETSQPNFDFDLLFDVAIQTVKNTYPLKNIKAEKHIACETIFNGTYFAAFNDIMLLLVQNAVRHSGVDRMDLALSATVTDGRASLVVANSVATSFDIHKLTEAAQGSIRQADPASSSHAIRTEGGTGFAKLRKLMTTDLGVADCNVEAGTSQDMFAVKITFDTRGLSLEPPSH